MSRIKEIYLELQNIYGADLKEMPEDFDIDLYLKQKADELENKNK